MGGSNLVNKKPAVLLLPAFAGQFKNWSIQKQKAPIRNLGRLRSAASQTGRCSGRLYPAGSYVGHSFLAAALHSALRTALAAALHSALRAALTAALLAALATLISLCLIIRHDYNLLEFLHSVGIHRSVVAITMPILKKVMMPCSLLTA